MIKAQQFSDCPAVADPKRASLEPKRASLEPKPVTGKNKAANTNQAHMTIITIYMRE